MNFSPKALFFDWDHTLWDHDLNAREVLLDTCFDLLASESKQLELSQNLQQLALPHATQTIVDICENVIGQ